ALGPEARAACDEAVGAGVTGSVAEFWRRTCLPRPAMENLVLVGAFDAVAPDRPRRALLWELREAEDVLPPRRRRGGGTGVPTLLAGTRARLEVPGAPAPTPPPARTGDGPAPAGPPRGRAAVAGDRPGDARRSPRHPDADPLPPLLVAPAPAPPLPPMGERDRTAAEYRVSELSTGPHLVAFLRPRLDALRCTPMREARARPNGSSLRVGGLVIARQAPASANGFRFFTLADEGGHLDLIFRPAVVRATRSVATFHQLLVVDGTLQSDSGRLNLMVSGVSAIDAEGRIIETARAAYGGGAAPDAPRSQHGHTAPARR